MHSIARILSILVLLVSRTALASPIVARTNAPTCLINGVEYLPTQPGFQECCDDHSSRMSAAQFNADPSAKKGEHVDADANRQDGGVTTMDGANQRKPAAALNAQVDASQSDPTANNAQVNEEQGMRDGERNASTTAKEDAAVGTESPAIPNDGANDEDQRQGSDRANVKTGDQGSAAPMDMEIKANERTASTPKNAKVTESNAKPDGPTGSDHANLKVENAQADEKSQGSGMPTESGTADIERHGSAAPMMDMEIASPFISGKNANERAGKKNAKPTDNAQVDASESDPTANRKDGQVNESVSPNAKATPSESLDPNAQVDEKSQGSAMPATESGGADIEPMMDLISGTSATKNENAPSTSTAQLNASKDGQVNEDGQVNDKNAGVKQGTATSTTAKEDVENGEKKSTCICPL